MAVVHKRRRAFLGAFDAAAWAAYQDGLNHGAGMGTPYGSLEDPNGGVIHFDENGLQDSYSPPAGFAPSPTGVSATDGITEKNPASTFYGWTELQKDAYYRAAYNQTGVIVTDMVRNSRKLPDGSYDPAVIAASDAMLLQIAQTDPKVRAAVAVITGGGTFRGEQQAAFDTQNARTVTQNAATQQSDVQRELAALIASGAVFADTIRPGGYTSAFLTGMLTTAQWVADRLSLLNGGSATNSAAMAGKIPPLPAGVYVIGSNADPGRYTSPSTGASTGFTQQTRGTNPDGSQVVWNEQTETWEPAGGRGAEFANANGGSAGANYSPVAPGVMPGGSDVGGLTLPGGVSPMLLLAGGAAVLLLLRRKH